MKYAIYSEIEKVYFDYNLYKRNMLHSDTVNYINWTVSTLAYRNRKLARKHKIDTLSLARSIIKIFSQTKQLSRYRYGLKIIQF